MSVADAVAGREEGPKPRAHQGQPPPQNRPRYENDGLPASLRLLAQRAAEEKAVEVKQKHFSGAESVVARSAQQSLGELLAVLRQLPGEMTAPVHQAAFEECCNVFPEAIAEACAAETRSTDGPRSKAPASSSPNFDSHLQQINVALDAQAEARHTTLRAALASAEEAAASAASSEASLNTKAINASKNFLNQIKRELADARAEMTSAVGVSAGSSVGGRVPTSASTSKPSILEEALACVRCGKTRDAVEIITAGDSDALISFLAVPEVVASRDAIFAGGSFSIPIFVKLCGLFEKALTGTSMDSILPHFVAIAYLWAEELRKAQRADARQPMAQQFAAAKPVFTSVRNTAETLSSSAENLASRRGLRQLKNFFAIQIQ